MEQEFQISLILESIVKELNLKILAYNICKDHIHIVLFSNKSDLSLIISKLK
jgi:REP element-mobilizing transposase RayT